MTSWNDDFQDRSCPVCMAGQLVDLDSPCEVPVLMNRLYPTAADARAVPLGPLVLRRCLQCGFVWNAAFRADLIDYDEAYENDQSHSSVFHSHIEERVRDVIAASELIDYLEVGCGQGGFIAELARLAGPRLRSAEGFDPAWRGHDGEGPCGSRIHKTYFGVDTVDRLEHTPNVVVIRHAVEHAQDPILLLTTIRNALGARSEAVIFVEMPCVDWILSHDAMQDLYYEHRSIFTARALGTALLSAGFFAPRVSHVFGGQYLWVRAQASGDAASDEFEKPLPFAAIEGMHQRFAQKWLARAAEAAQSGSISIWGAGAKGANFALLVDSEGTIFDHVVDINPAKQGLYLPGSGLRVIPPAESVGRRTATYFVMNPNYLDEIAALLRPANPFARLIALNQATLL
ncbi:MAG: class I SAM-dependent methyltransferase [Methylocella sp.]